MVRIFTLASQREFWWGNAAHFFKNYFFIALLCNSLHPWTLISIYFRYLVDFFLNMNFCFNFNVLTFSEDFNLLMPLKLNLQTKIFQLTLIYICWSCRSRSPPHPSSSNLWHSFGSWQWALSQRVPRRDTVTDQILLLIGSMDDRTFFFPH